MSSRVSASGQRLSTGSHPLSSIKKPPPQWRLLSTFDTKVPILNSLNASAELAEYTVEDVNLGDSTVNVRRGMIQERYDKLETDEKSKNQQLKRLEGKIEDLEREVAGLKDKSKVDNFNVHRWELLSRAIQGLNLFLWRTVLQQRQRNELHAMSINTCMSMLS